MMALSRAISAILAGAATLLAVGSASSCPPHAESGADATSWINLVQTRYTRDRREAILERAGDEVLPVPSPNTPASAEAAPADGTVRKLRGVAVGRGHKPEESPPSLAAVGVAVSHKGSQSGPKDAGWFQAFSEGESTFDTDGEVQASGWDSNNWAPGEEISGYLPLKPTPLPGKWFQESKSGGAAEAWQTFYPAVPDTKPRGQPNAGWRETVYGGWQQPLGTYQPEAQVVHWTQAKENKGPMWFDTAVGEYDAFGRSRAPSVHSKRRYIEWDRRTKKVNLTCSSVGCAANASFPELFNHTEEQRRLCLLSIAIHATDFDDEFSRERVEFFKANGETVGVNCDPMTQGSTPEAQEALYPCVTELNIDKIIKDDGKLFVEGKLNSMVDEFPRNGNLLDGEATVSCLVRKRPEWHKPDPIPVDAKFNTTLANLFKPQTVTKRFSCNQPGCVAETLLKLGAQAVVNRTCKLTVKVHQTDFDGNLGTDESVEFLKVNGKTVKESVKPGKNPCKQAADLGQSPPNTSQLQAGNGSNATDEANASSGQNMFTLLEEADVSEDVKNGTITITSKISDMVDECGYQGALLSGIAVLHCEVSHENQEAITEALEGHSGNATENITKSSDNSEGAASTATEKTSNSSSGASSASTPANDTTQGAISEVIEGHSSNATQNGTHSSDDSTGAASNESISENKSSGASNAPTSDAAGDAGKDATENSSNNGSNKDTSSGSSDVVSKNGSSGAPNASAPAGNATSTGVDPDPGSSASGDSKENASSGATSLASGNGTDNVTANATGNTSSGS